VTLHRFCCPDAAPDGDRVRITGPVAAQIRRVLRLGPGDQVILFGADEWEYTVQLESVQPDAALGRVVARAAPRAEPRCELTLAMALLKGEKLEWVLQKGTELGVARFVLMQTERTITAPDERRIAGRRERYARIVRESTEQCGRVRPPCIEGVQPFSHALAEISPAAAFILHTEAVDRLSDLLRRSETPDYLKTSLTLFVGPEGGFSQEEIALAASRGVAQASLGSRVLRAETAALAAVTLAMDALDR
jgi:16S rRNA (uracil1498-N3)-methyltransferase